MDLVIGRARAKRRIGLQAAHGGSNLPTAARSTYAMRAAQADGEPLELSHGDRPWLRFALALVIASIWSVTLREVKPGIERIAAGLDWSTSLQALVILFVVGVQAFLTFTALRTLLQALTPGPRLVLDTRRLVPGAETELVWRAPRWPHPRGITITLEGRALRSDANGEGESVEFTTFHEDELCRDEQAAAGRLPVEVPADARPSETSAYFEVQWLLRFRGRNAYWPDLQRAYVLWVQPAEEAKQAA